MANLKVLLCGATDIKYYAKSFDRVIKEMGCDPAHFLNATAEKDNYSKWEDNSRVSVVNSDVIIYLIVEKYGEITWNTEFITAKANGKPFILLCAYDTYTAYYTLGRDYRFPELETDETQTDKIFKLIRSLDSQQVTIVPFDSDTFENILKKEIVLQFRKGLDLLAQSNKQSKLISIIKAKDFHASTYKILSEEERNLYIEIALDIFQNKEIRKRIIVFLAHNGGLDDKHVLALIYDAEQGVARKAVSLLSKLVKRDSDLDLIFENIIQVSNEDSDFGLERRAIKSMFEIDPIKATKYLKSFFPAGDIGTPRRILQWVDNNFNEISSHLTDQSSIDSLKAILELSKGFKKETSLSDLYESAMEKLTQLIQAKNL